MDADHDARYRSLAPLPQVGHAAIDPGSVAHIIQTRTGAAGFDPTALGGHSLKRGALSTGRRRGADQDNGSTTRWRMLVISTTLQRMDTANIDTGKTPRSETEADRQDRIAWEAERIAEARADVAAGRLVSSAKVKAWIDSIGNDHELPVPYSTK